MAGKLRWSTATMLLVMSIIVIIWNLWSLYLNPQHLPFFLIVSIAVMAFATVVALRPKFRQRLVKAVYAFHTKGQEKGGWCYRFGYIALLTIIFSALALTRYQLIPPQYSTVFVIAFLMLITVSVGILAISFWRVIGKWVLLLIGVAVAVGILRALTIIDLVAAVSCAIYALSHVL